MKTCFALLLVLFIFPAIAMAERPLAKVTLSPDGKDFRQGGSDEPFYVWGVNYDHDRDDYGDDDRNQLSRPLRCFFALGASRKPLGVIAGPS